MRQCTLQVLLFHIFGVRSAQFMLEYCEFLDQQIAGLSYEDLQVISYFTEHYHLIMNQQVIEGKDKFTDSLEHFSS